MIICYANDSIFGIKMLDDRYCYFKEQSCGQKISNLIFFLVRKRHMADEMRLVLIDIVVIMLVLLMVLLAMTHIIL